MTQLTIDPTFSKRTGEWAAAAGRNITEAFKIQGRFLCHELIQRTPPFSGKSIVRMLSARDNAKQRDLGIDGLSALKVGQRRVEKDIKKFAWAAKQASDWGVRQKCEGKAAIRVFATKTGEVYGVDEANFIPDADESTLGKFHQQNRTSRGRVTTAGQKTRNIGRWRWMNVIVTTDKAIHAFIKKKQGNVGRAKGGWARSYMDLGGRMSPSGWVGKHAGKTGECRKILDRPWNAEITMINRSEWASGGDDRRIIAASLAGRDRAVKADIERLLKEKWG